MSWPQTHPTFTPDEYLALERPSEIRHEYLDGTVYAMAGETPEHSIICFNLAVIAGGQLKGKPCQGYSPNMKVRTDSSGLFAYPDLMIVCGQPTYHDERRDVITNPTVIFEVLSRSTEKYDRGAKALRYQNNIDALKQLVLVSQQKPEVELFSREADGSWKQTKLSGPDSVLTLESVGCEFRLSEIYSGIDFAAL